MIRIVEWRGPTDHDQTSMPLKESWLINISPSTDLPSDSCRTTSSASLPRN
jgi:hypothetical protein